MNTTATTVKLGLDLQSGDILVNNWNSDRLPITLTSASEAYRKLGVCSVAQIPTHSQRMTIVATREYTVIAK